MNEHDKNLDALLTSDEATEQADRSEPKSREASLADATESTRSDNPPAGRQPEEDKAEQQTGKADINGTGEEDKQASKPGTVPVATFIEQRRAFRDQARASQEANRILRERVEALERAQTELRNRPEEDDEEPVTKADLRRMEAERAELNRRQTHEGEAQRVRRALQLAEPVEERVLLIAEPYFSDSDRRRIVESDDPLHTALLLAEARINAYGTDKELEWLQRRSANVLAKLSPSQSQSRANETSPTEKQTPVASASKPGEGQSPERDESLPNNTRSILDHMFG